MRNLPFSLKFQSSRQDFVIKRFFFYFQTRLHVYVVDAQKNRLNEIVQRDGSFEQPEHMLELVDKKAITI